MSLAVYPGTFDPITLGHLDIVRRASTMFDRIVLGIAQNAAKDSGRLFDLDTRVALARRALADLPGAEVDVVPGLLADYCRDRGADAIVKGLRNGTDLDAEAPMALLNRDLGAPETVFLTASPAYAHISSSLVKDIAGYGRDVSALVPPAGRPGPGGPAGRQTSPVVPPEPRPEQRLPRTRPTRNPARPLRRRRPHTRGPTVTTSRDAGDDLLHILDELDDLITHARSMPMSASAIVNREAAQNLTTGPVTRSPPPFTAPRRSSPTPTPSWRRDAPSPSGSCSTPRRSPSAWWPVRTSCAWPTTGPTAS